MTELSSLLSLTDHLLASAGFQGLNSPGGNQSAIGSPGGGGESLMLVSLWKPVLAVIPFLAWAWVIATIYDKDAQRFNLKRRQWNLLHITIGVIALAAVLVAPSFWIGWPAMLVLLGGDLIGYSLVRNASSRVPQSERWRLNLKEFQERRKQRAAQKRARTVELTLRGPSGAVAPPQKDSPEYQVRVAAEALLIDAIEARASRLEIAPSGENAYTSTFVVDGVRQSAERHATADAVAIIDFLKGAAGLDVNDRRRRLRADMQMERASGGKRTLRVISSGGSSGLRLSVTFDPVEQVRLSLDELGFLEPQRKQVEELIAEDQGTVLLGTPPHNGRTTLMYSLLRSHDAYTTNVQTVELEPEDQIEGVRHNVFDPMKEGAEYSTTARSILRRDPDVVAIAELPDANTAKEIANADHERTRTYACLRADSALAAIQTFVKAVGDPEVAAKALHGVIAERLLRRLCQNCRVVYQPSADLLKKLGTSPEKVQKLYKRGGQVLIKNKPETCPICGGSGFFGQEGIFEVFPIGPDERQLIAAGDLIGLRSAFRKMRLPSIQEAAILKATMGATSVEEVARVTSTGQQKKVVSPDRRQQRRRPDSSRSGASGVASQTRVQS